MSEIAYRYSYKSSHTELSDLSNLLLLCLTDLSSILLAQRKHSGSGKHQAFKALQPAALIDPQNFSILLDFCFLSTAPGGGGNNSTGILLWYVAQKIPSNESYQGFCRSHWRYVRADYAPILC